MTMTPRAFLWIAAFATAAAAFVPASPTYHVVVGRRSSALLATTNSNGGSSDSISAAFQQAASLAEAELDKLRSLNANLELEVASQSHEVEKLRTEVAAKEKTMIETQHQEAEFRQNLERQLQASFAEKEAELQELQKAFEEEKELRTATQAKLEDAVERLKKQEVESGSALETAAADLNEANKRAKDQQSKIQQLQEDLLGKEEADRIAQAEEEEATKMAARKAEEMKLKAEQEALKAGEAEVEAKRRAAEETLAEKKALEEGAKKKAAQDAADAQKAAIESKKVAAQKALEAKKEAAEAQKRAAQEVLEKKKAAAEARQIAAQEALEAKRAAAEARRVELLEEKRLKAEADANRRTGGIPEVNDWVINAEGGITGKVSGHPTIKDGEMIQTSPLANPASASEQNTVMTKSGSKYRLGTSLESVSGVIDKKTKLSESSSNSVQKEAKVAEPESVEPTEDVSDQFADLGLTGKTAGANGKYLLAGSARPSRNNRSMLYTAYQSDSNGRPKGDALAIKASSNKDGMERERANYLKVTGGFGNFRKGMFASQRDYLPEAGGSLGSKQSALVIERGVDDLRNYVFKRGPMTGRELRNAASSAVQCVEALHSAGLVWTDLKTENFIIVPAKGSTPMVVKGIDLESAMPVKQNPVDYSPEACPPEFALKHLVGESSDFTLEYSYDIWSLGMFLFELTTGQGYFAADTPTSIMKKLPGLEPAIDGIPDKNMADLISKCLLSEPERRPTAAQVLIHPYFLTTGLGPFSF